MSPTASTSGNGYRPPRARNTGSRRPWRRCASIAEFTVLTGLGHPSSEGGDTRPRHVAHRRLSQGPTGIRIHEHHVDRPGGRRLARERDPVSVVAVRRHVGHGRGEPQPHPLLRRHRDAAAGREFPRRLFERLFVPDTAGDRAATRMRYAERRSILDNIAAEARGLKSAGSAPPIAANSTNTCRASGRPRRGSESYSPGSRSPN